MNKKVFNEVGSFMRNIGVDNFIIINLVNIKIFSGVIKLIKLFIFFIGRVIIFFCFYMLI